MKIVITFLIAILTISVGYSCQCTSRNNLIWEYLFESDIVFTGTITSVDTIETKKILHFNVDKNYKNCCTAQVDIITGLGGSDCGIYDIGTDEKWLIFASAQYGGYFTSRCTRSCKSLSKGYEKKIKELESLFSDPSNAITIKTNSKIAKGKISKNGAVGKWTVFDQTKQLTEIKYYSATGVLDSVHIKKDDILFVRKILSSNCKTTLLFNTKGQLDSKIFEKDSVFEKEFVTIHRMESYYNSGIIKEKTEFMSFYNKNSYDLEYNTSFLMEYYKTGDIKMIQRTDKFGNQQEKFYEKNKRPKKRS